MEQLRAEVELLRAEAREGFWHVHDRLDAADEGIRLAHEGIRDAASHIGTVAGVVDRSLGMVSDALVAQDARWLDHEARLRALERKQAS